MRRRSLRKRPDDVSIGAARVGRRHPRNRHAPPHNVMSKTSSCGWKNAFTEQSDAGQFATGMPSVEVSTLVTLPCSWLGIEVRWSPCRSGFASRPAVHIIDTHIEIPDAASEKRQNGLRKEREARAGTHEMPSIANSVTYTPPPELAKSEMQGWNTDATQRTPRGRPHLRRTMRAWDSRRCSLGCRSTGPNSPWS